MSKRELGDGEPSPKVGGVCTGLRGGCESDPSGLHECGVEENHKLCVCANCGANWPNPEWHGAAQEVSPPSPPQELFDRFPSMDANVLIRIYSVACKMASGDTRELKAALWIPVQEQLPEYGTVSLVYGYNDDCEKIPYQDIATYSYHGGWCVGLDKSVEYVVTHWQYLPEPPELG